jgi:hypothetical protein
MKLELGSSEFKRLVREKIKVVAMDLVLNFHIMSYL